MRTVIIEDERAAARNIVAILEQTAPEVEVLAILDSVVESVEWFESHPTPDVVFMDIHLADGSAFDIFERVEVLCPIIFTTAYDEYAIKAFKVNSIDYILKPIAAEDVRRALDKMSAFRVPSKMDDNLLNLVNLMRRSACYTTHMLVPRGGDKLVPLAMVEVEYFWIEDGIVQAVTIDAARYVIPHTLDEVTEMVDPARFFRVNRQFLVTREAVLDIDLWFGSRLSVNLRLRPEERIVVSKQRVSEFKAWFGGRQN